MKTELLCGVAYRCDDGPFVGICYMTSSNSVCAAQPGRAECGDAVRQPDGGWLLMTYAGPRIKARIRCLGIELPLREIYAKVHFPAAER